MSKINPRKLLAHPFNLKVYGVEVLDPEFLQSIREKGIMEPVMVTSTTLDGVAGLYILSGHRRTLAAMELGIDVPYRIEQDQGILWQESLLLEANRQRKKSAEQMAREFTELKRLELAWAEKRRARGIFERGAASDRAATQTGIQAPWARKMEVVIAAADSGDEAAAAGLAKINSGELTVESVYRTLQPRQTSESKVYDDVAQTLQNAVGFFNVKYSPQSSDPQHGYVFKRRFVCEEEALAFLKLLEAIPEDARNEFARQSQSWRKS